MTNTNDALREQIFTQITRTEFMVQQALPRDHSSEIDYANNLRADAIMKAVLADRKRLIERLETEAVGEDEVEDIDLSKGAKSRWGVRARNRVRVEIRQRIDTIKQDETS